MSTVVFDRDEVAEWYATQHLKVDIGLVSVHYLPGNCDSREIRLVEVNELLGDRTDESLQPIDFGVEMGTESAHRLFVLDVTPEQCATETRELESSGQLDPSRLSHIPEVMSQSQALC